MLPSLSESFISYAIDLIAGGDGHAALTLRNIGPHFCPLLVGPCIFVICPASFIGAGGAFLLAGTGPVIIACTGGAFLLVGPCFFAKDPDFFAGAQIAFIGAALIWARSVCLMFFWTFL